MRGTILYVFDIIIIIIIIIATEVYSHCFERILPYAYNIIYITILILSSRFVMLKLSGNHKICNIITNIL